MLECTCVLVYFATGRGKRKVVLYLSDLQHLGSTHWVARHWLF